MIPVLMETILNSAAVGLTAALCIRPLRSRKSRAGTVFSSILPLGAAAMPIRKHLHIQPANSSVIRPAYPMTLLQELQELLQSRSKSGLPSNRTSAAVSTANSPQTEKPSCATPGEVSDSQKPEASRAISIQVNQSPTPGLAAGQLDDSSTAAMNVAPPDSR